ncbi:SCO family protein [Piscibacillus halophilus]|uniref:Protein SCO1/2 n=1 Tax=Piscibacillus halophilus TaxID=571933 RepID=A0A1H9KL69_9BACI|nr:SCO family protein [Piscibacillus halophilus]SEQ99901.1 protein SCO1/2 [Piscibacillus halophilus]
MFKNLKIVLFSLITIMLLVACGDDHNSSANGNQNNDEQEIKPEFEEEVQDFSFTNQDDETVSLDDLKGEYWVADLIFTNCETVCPPMTANMAKLQQMLDEEGIDIRLVSFSVDPQNDDPETLKAFGDKHGADYSNWDFLTGYSQEDIESFASKSFKALVSKVDGDDQVTHDTSFMLVSPEGDMINRFKGTSFEEMESIVEYLKHYKK